MHEIRLRMQQLAERWEAQAASLREKVKDTIAEDGYGELWRDPGYQERYSTLLSCAWELRQAAGLIEE